MLMVRVNVGEGKEPIVGLLIDTHLLPVTGPPKAAIGEGGKLIQTQGQSGLQGMGVVATDKGFLVGPLASMTPIMNPDDEEGSADDIPTELRPGEGRKEEGE